MNALIVCPVLLLFTPVLHRLATAAHIDPAIRGHVNSSAAPVYTTGGIDCWSGCPAVPANNAIALTSWQNLNQGQQNDHVIHQLLFFIQWPLAWILNRQRGSDHQQFIQTVALCPG